MCACVFIVIERTFLDLIWEIFSGYFGCSVAFGATFLILQLILSGGSLSFTPFTAFLTVGTILYV